MLGIGLPSLQQFGKLGGQARTIDMLLLEFANDFADVRVTLRQRRKSR